MLINQQYQILTNQGSLSIKSLLNKPIRTDELYFKIVKFIQDTSNSFPIAIEYITGEASFKPIENQNNIKIGITILKITPSSSYSIPYYLDNPPKVALKNGALVDINKLNKINAFHIFIGDSIISEVNPHEITHEVRDELPNYAVSFLINNQEPEGVIISNGTPYSLLLYT